MQQAINLSALAVKHGNEPFGAVLVKDGQVATLTKTKSIQPLTQLFMLKLV